MTKEEAIDLIAAEGTKVIGLKVHPRSWGLFEWAEIMARAIKKNPGLMKEIEEDEKTGFSKTINRVLLGDRRN